MGSPEVPGQGEPPDPEPPYRPWPGEQLPYTPSAASAGDFTEPAPPPRRRHAWLRLAALLVAVVGISTGAVLFSQDTDPGSTIGGGTGESIETTDEPTDEPTPSEDTGPSDPGPTDTVDPTESETDSEETYVDDLAVGDCADVTESAIYVLIVPCDGPHDLQTLANTELEDGFEYPGDDVIEEEAAALCDQAYWDAAENWTSEEEDGLDWAEAVPNAESWEVGDRTVVCFLESVYGDPLEQDWLSDAFFS